MRKIEQNMVAAIQSGKEFHCDNTEVSSRAKCGPDLYRCTVKLHGNEILRIYFTGNGSMYPVNFQFSLAGWNTRTTRSRINAAINAFCDGTKYGLTNVKGNPNIWNGDKLMRINDINWMDVPTNC